MSDEARRLLSVVVPAYNEQESLRALYERIAECAPTDLDLEIWFVDDGSTDDTAKVARTLAAEDPRVHLISFRRNLGKSAALEAGFKNVGGDIVVTMDADLQDDPSELPRFVEKIDEGYDLVSGWKRERHDPFEKRAASRLFNAVVSRMSGISLHDFDCGFKAYRREVVDAIDVYGEMHRYLPCLAHRKGFRIAEIEVRHNPRKFGKSKFGAERYLRGFFDFLTVSFLDRFRNKPMHFFGRVGLASMFLGFLICVYLVCVKIAGNAIGTRPLLTLGVLLILIGFQFFSTGILGDMIVDATHRYRYDESHIREKV